MHIEYLNIDYEELKSSAVEAIKNEMGSRGFDRAVIGVSGGLDSAVTLTLTAQAIGRSNISCYFMPYKTSSKRSRDDAFLIAEHNKVTIEEIDISEQIDLYFRQFDETDRMRIGNKCARERMSILFDMALFHGGLVIGTSNRSELTMGYGTLFGDLGCSLNPIGNVLKTQIYRLADYLHIPERIISKKPSADLWEDQTDEGEMGVSYEIIDRFIYQYFDLGRDLESIISSGIERHFCELILNAYNKNKFKRECPAILNVNIKRR